MNLVLILKQNFKLTLKNFNANLVIFLYNVCDVGLKHRLLGIKIYFLGNFLK